MAEERKYPVMVRPTWQGIFSRTIRIPVKEIEPGAVHELPADDGPALRIEKMSFGHNTPVDCTREQLTALLPDVGKSLCIAKYDEKMRPRPDWDKTERLASGEPIDEVFADVPPIVTTPGGQEEAILLKDSLIPSKYHATLKKHQLPTLESIALYLEEHNTLLGLQGIGEKANKEILEALEAHAEPAPTE